MGSRREIGNADVQNAPSTVPLVSIVNNPRNRRPYDEDEVERLAASIAEVGLLQPIGVMRYEVYLSHFPEDEQQIGTHDWVALYGNNRLHACRLVRDRGLAEMLDVPVVVADRLGREGKIRAAVLVENIQRSSLPPLAEAEEVAELVAEVGNQREAARRLGVTQGFVSQRMKLLKLAPDLRAAVDAGTLKIEDARSLASLPVTKQAQAWEALRVQKEASANGSDDYAVITPSKQPPKQPSKTSGDYGVITPSKQITTSPATTPSKITLGTPEEIADQLHQHLSSESFTQLVNVMLERIEH